MFIKKLIKKNNKNTFYLNFMKILITGVAGFIGFKYAEFLLKKKHKIIGIDNLNNYYDVKLKKNRVQELKKFKNFKFIKLNLENSSKLNKIFKINRFKYVFHFAAQAGVRYAIISPRDYIKSNINGFFNILEMTKKYKVKRLFISSSSSVYGDENKYPSKENFNVKPNNIYSLSKKFNEDLAESYSKFYNLNITALRFFTVYGEWGRPDMFYMKFIISAKNKKILYLNNNGNHYRDFTYINDVVNILYKLYLKKNHKKFEIFNVCGNRPIKISNLVINLKSFLGKVKIKQIKKNKADVYKTHGSNKKLLKKIGKYNFTPISTGLRNTINWYNLYNKK